MIVNRVDQAITELRPVKVSAQADFERRLTEAAESTNSVTRPIPSPSPSPSLSSFLRSAAEAVLPVLAEAAAEPLQPSPEGPSGPIASERPAIFASPGSPEERSQPEAASPNFWQPPADQESSKLSAKTPVTGSSTPALNPRELDRLIVAAARRHGLSPGLVKAVALAESGLDPTAVSSAGAQGLMQLMPATAQELGLTEPFDPAQNLDAGCRYLKRLLTKYDGRLKTALAAYNWGQGNLGRHGQKALPSETRSFVGRVLRTQDSLAKGLPA